MLSNYNPEVVHVIIKKNKSHMSYPSLIKNGRCNIAIFSSIEARQNKHLVSCSKIPYDDTATHDTSININAASHFFPTTNYLFNWQDTMS
jgi:hypothetical protein